MASLVFIPQQSEIYSENLLSPFCNFDEPFSWNIVSGIGSVGNGNLQTFSGSSALSILNESYNTTNVLVFNSGGTQMNFTAQKTGLYYLSLYAFIESVYSNENIPFTVKIFKNGSALDSFDLVLGTENNEFFKNNQWNRYAQQIQLNGGDELTFEFKVGFDLTSLNSTVRVLIDGMKLEINDRGIEFPPLYLPAKVRETGFQVITDGASTLATPLLIPLGTTLTLLNNAISNELQNLPSDVLSMYDTVLNKFLFKNVENYVQVSLFFKAKSSVADDVFEVYFDVNGNKMKAQTLGVSTFESGYILNIPMNNNGSFITYGAIPKITAGAGNLSIYDITFETARLIK